mmetsp:Transcript_99739/g.197825  ORF Transcript_99739/g.197825 Transcript_99739/m.197825 type:complete len:215 (+) Transcript_99739:226-870(+)
MPDHSLPRHFACKDHCSETIRPSLHCSCCGTRGIKSADLSDHEGFFSIERGSTLKAVKHSIVHAFWQCVSPFCTRFQLDIKDLHADRELRWTHCLLQWACNDASLPTLQRDQRNRFRPHSAIPWIILHAVLRHPQPKLESMGTLTLWRATAFCMLNARTNTEPLKSWAVERLTIAQRVCMPAPALNDVRENVHAMMWVPGDIKTFIAVVAVCTF